MPKQSIIEGRGFTLVPFRNGSEDTRTPAEITAEAEASGDWSSHFHDGPRAAREEGDGIIAELEPSVTLHWSKARIYSESGLPAPDGGHVTLEMLVDAHMLKRIMQGHERFAEANPNGVPAFIPITTGPLSWRDLNVAIKALKDARDGAFGKPE